MKRSFMILIMMVAFTTIMNAQKCSRCDDTGRIREVCLSCHGNGKSGCNYCNGGYKMCTVCMNEGSFECGSCDGTGKVSVLPKNRRSHSV